MALQHAPQYWPDIETGLRRTTDTLNNCINGGGNNTDEVTLTAGAASTVVTDTRVSVSSAIILMPTTANAAGAISSTYITTDKGSFTINHANNGQTDRTFQYGVIGS